MTSAHHRMAKPPSPLVTVTLLLCGTLGALSLMRGIFDTDYFWHVATGRLIVQTGSVPHADPFSFTWLGSPWTPDQWLSELLLYALVEFASPLFALFVFGVIAGSSVCIVAWAAHRIGVRWRAGLGVAVLAAAVMFPLVTARPQVISQLLLGIELAILLVLNERNRRLALALPALMLLWANVHGMYVVGLGVGALYLLATVLGRTPLARHKWYVGSVAAVSVAACAVTPSGIAGLGYSLSFADASDWGAKNISEWQSPNFHDPQVLPLLVMIVALVLTASRVRVGWVQALAVLGAVLSLLALRSIGVGALLMMPAVAMGVNAMVGSRGRHSPSQERGRRWVEFAAALTVVLAVSWAAAGRASSQPEVSNDRFPVRGIDLLVKTMPDARVLSRYGWGGYVIERMHRTGGSVFVDGRMHKYEPQLLEDYSTIVGAGPGWNELLDQYEVDALLLSPDAQVLKGFAQADGWCEAYRDETQVLLLRDCQGVAGTTS